VVGRHDAGHDRLAEAERRLDHHLVLAAADGVDREHHARDVRIDHPLHHHGHAQVAEAPLRLR
jgi:hypothetical protein